MGFPPVPKNFFYYSTGRETFQNIPFGKELPTEPRPGRSISSWAFYLFGSFARSFSYKTAILLSTVFFTLTHFTISWPTVFVIGVLLAWIYWRTDNLAVTMVIHGTINFFSLLSIPLYALLTTYRIIGVIVCLFVAFLGVAITYLSIKMFLQKHDALPT